MTYLSPPAFEGRYDWETIQNDMRTAFSFSYFEPTEQPMIESFFYDDGARSLEANFLIPGPLDASGSFPKQLQPSQVRVGHEAWTFSANPNGTWSLGLEFKGAGTECNIESTEGPGGCVFGHLGYEAVGIYNGWHRVPEPTTVGLLGLALGIMGGLRSRARQIDAY